MAASFGDHQALRILLENNADPNALGRQGVVPLHDVLAYNVCGECARMLIAHKNTDLNALDKVQLISTRLLKYNDQFTHTHTKHQIRNNSHAQEGRTLLQVARASNKFFLVKRLLLAGAIDDDEGSSAKWLEARREARRRA